MIFYFTGDTHRMIGWGIIYLSTVIWARILEEDGR